MSQVLVSSTTTKSRPAYRSNHSIAVSPVAAQHEIHGWWGIHTACHWAAVCIPLNMLSGMDVFRLVSELRTRCDPLRSRWRAPNPSSVSEVVFHAWACRTCFGAFCCCAALLCRFSSRRNSLALRRASRSCCCFCCRANSARPHCSKKYSDRRVHRRTEHISVR